MRVSRVLGTLCLVTAGVLTPAPPLSANPNVSYGVTVAVKLPAEADTVRVGRQRYHVYKGSFYQEVKAGYVLVPPPIGAKVRELPRGTGPGFRIGRTTYFRHGDVCFRQVGRAFQVCEPPAEIALAEKGETNAEDPLTVRRGDETYMFIDGRFYLRSPEGLLGRAIPIGAVAEEFPPDAMSVWFRGREYFECNGVFFREVGDGFEVVPPPWQRTKVSPDDAVAHTAAN